MSRRGRGRVLLSDQGSDRRDLCDALNGRFDRPYDWHRLVSEADGEGVAPLLRRSLEDHGQLDRIPEPARRALHRAHFVTAANNLLILNELCRVMDALGGGVPEVRPVVLKGADLAMTVYPGIALRPMCDLDLLVPREALDEGVRRVCDLGYREVFPEVASGHSRLTGHAVCLQGGPHESVAVEMHWGLVGGDHDWRSPDLDWFWEQTEEWKQGPSAAVSEQPPGGKPSRLPSSFYHLTPSAHLLYLSAHLMFQHRGSEARLVWLYDLHLLVCHDQSRLDWEEILAKAREFHWTAALHDSLDGARECFDTPLPDGFLEKLAEGTDRRAEKLRQQLSKPSPGRGELGWKEIGCLSWPARLRFAWNHFFPSAAYVSWRYKPKPKWLWPLCYPYRWGVILIEGLLALGRWVGHRYRVGEENP